MLRYAADENFNNEASRSAATDVPVKHRLTNLLVIR
jgi:hypothetical protein